VTPLGQQLLGERLVGRQVQVGEEGEVLAQPVVLLLDRLLDLEDHVGLAPDVVGAQSTMRAPWATNSSSVIEEPRPAPFWMSTSWPWATSSWTPTGVMRDPVFVVLDLAGIPTFTGRRSPRRGPTSGSRSTEPPSQSD
jgi:hypothetical protein